MTAPHVSFALPTLNEEGAIAKVIGEIKKNCAGYNSEIVICDSSADRTAEIAENLGVTVIRHRSGLLVMSVRENGPAHDNL